MGSPSGTSHGLPPGQWGGLGKCFVLRCPHMVQTYTARGLASTSLRSWGPSTPCATGCLRLLPTDTPRPKRHGHPALPHPRIPKAIESYLAPCLQRPALGLQKRALRAVLSAGARELGASAGLAHLSLGPVLAGAASGPERGEASVPRDLALLPVNHQAGECEWPGPRGGGGEPASRMLWAPDRRAGEGVRGHGQMGTWEMGRCECPGL